ncbi:DUF84 family protein [Turicibacter sp. TJ11]|uniref:DUF84 family protein n=1 Tax=Turicibacter sp. TJ11 TaxID=2806443 RepID=UPI001F46F863|nr:DUF84 family protein [Turicibacter sp. TJ11]
MKVIVGSTNRVKINAVKDVLSEIGCEVIGVDAPSGVSNQPFSDAETVAGASHRAEACLAFGEIGIGLEAGVEYLNNQLYLVNWGVLKTSDHQCFYAGGTRLPLPIELIAPLEAGQELGDVIDAYSKRQNVRSNEGAIGILTADFFNRQENFSHIVRLLWGQYQYAKQSCRK